MADRVKHIVNKLSGNEDLMLNKLVQHYLHCIVQVPL